MKENKKKTILFDFDGVIVDSFQPAFEVSRDIRKSWMNFTENDYRKCFEGNVFDSFARIDKGKNVATEKFFKIYIPRFLKLPTIDGIVDALEELSKKYRLIIISSTISSPIRKWFTEHNLVHYFTEVMGGDVHESKVEKIKMVFKKYEIVANDCVFITDTLGDLREANEMGINSLVVTYGFHDKDTLKKGKPVGFIKKPQDMVFKIEKYWKKYKN